MQAASPTKSGKKSLQRQILPVLAILVVLCALNVFILERSQAAPPSSIQAETMTPGEFRKRQLASVPTLSNQRPSLNDAKVLQMKAKLELEASDMRQSNKTSSGAKVASEIVDDGAGIGLSQMENDIAIVKSTSETAHPSRIPSGNVTVPVPGIALDGTPAALQAEKHLSEKQFPSSSASQSSSDEDHVGSRHLTLAFAQGIDESSLTVFVSSLRSVSSTTVVLLTNTLSDHVKKICDKYGILSEHFDLSHLEPPRIRSYQGETYRWFLFRNYLEQNWEGYDKVLIADVDDTAFQSDPFDVVLAPGLVVSRSNEKWIDRGRTSGSLQACYGKELANNLGTKEVTDNGVLLGTSSEMRAYLEQLTLSMATAEFASCQKKGADQVAHHALQHTGRIVGLRILSQLDGSIAHLSAGQMRSNKNMTVVNQMQERVPIVHQYDVDARLAQKLYSKFVDPDLRFEKQGRGKCRAFLVQSNVLSFDSSSMHVHFAPESALSLDRCCEMCLERRASGCVGFIYDKPKSSCIFKGAGTTTPSGSRLVMPGATSGLLVA